MGTLFTLLIMVTILDEPLSTMFTCNLRHDNNNNNKHALFTIKLILKTPRLIEQCHSLPYSVLRMRKGQCKHFECGFTPVSNPKNDKKG